MTQVHEQTPQERLAARKELFAPVVDYIGAALKAGRNMWDPANGTYPPTIPHTPDAVAALYGTRSSRLAPLDTMTALQAGRDDPRWATLEDIQRAWPQAKLKDDAQPIPTVLASVLSDGSGKEQVRYGRGQLFNLGDFSNVPAFENKRADLVPGDYIRQNISTRESLPIKASDNVKAIHFDERTGQIHIPQTARDSMTDKQAAQTLEALVQYAMATEKDALRQAKIFDKIESVYRNTEGERSKPDIVMQHAMKDIAQRGALATAAARFGAEQPQEQHKRNSQYLAEAAEKDPLALVNVAKAAARLVQKALGTGYYRNREIEKKNLAEAMPALMAKLPREAVVGQPYPNTHPGGKIVAIVNTAKRSEIESDQDFEKRSRRTGYALMEIKPGEDGRPRYLAHDLRFLRGHHLEAGQEYTISYGNRDELQGWAHPMKLNLAVEFNLDRAQREAFKDFTIYRGEAKANSEGPIQLLNTTHAAQQISASEIVLHKLSDLGLDQPLKLGEIYKIAYDAERFGSVAQMHAQQRPKPARARDDENER